MGYRGRDVEVAAINETQYLVAACDSCGAIGMKELDAVQVPWRITGRFTARVALLEILASGTIPQMLTVAISNEPEPAGAEILAGVREELQALNLPKLPIAISTEKNIPTLQTGLGVTAVGTCEKAELRIGRSKAGDDIWCLGLPKVGAEITRADDPEIVQGRQLLELLEVPGVHDIIPVGSRGIRGEAQALAEIQGLEFAADMLDAPGGSGGLSLDKSAGPSTCVIFTIGEHHEFFENKQSLQHRGVSPVYKVGRLVAGR